MNLERVIIPLYWVFLAWWLYWVHCAKPNGDAWLAYVLVQDWGRP